MDTREVRFTYGIKQIPSREEWEKARMDGIGTSELAQACGNSKFGSANELWRLKTGLDKPQPQNEDMKRGHELEPKVRSRFMRDYGTYFELEYHEFWMYYRSDYGMIFATLDGILKARMDFVLQLPGCAPMAFHAGERAILEIKNPQPRYSFTYKDWDRLPDHYRYQNAGQMFCTGIEKHIEIANLTGEYAQPDEQGMDLRYWTSQYGDYLTIMEEIRTTIPKVWKDILDRQPVPTAIVGAKNEVIVLNTKVELGLITENLDKVKGSIEAYAKQFEGIKFTEAQYSEAKDFRKELNSQIKLIDDARKSVKKQWTEPLDAFEKKCKELSSIIENVKAPIDSQILDFENKEKEDKKKECDKLMELALQTLPENYQDIIKKSDGIAFNEKWLNRTTKLNAIKKEIEAIIETEKNNLDVLFSGVLANADDSIRDAVLNAYTYHGRSLPDAIRTRDELVAMKAEREKREAEARAQEALRKAQMEAQRQQAEEEPRPTPEPVVEPSPAPANPAPKQQVGARLIMEVSHPNKAMFAELSRFMTENGFTFKRIG